MTAKRFTITQDFEEHHRQIRDNGHIIMGCFLEPQAEPIVKLLNELHEENMMLRGKHTQLIILLKDIVNDLKRMDTKGYAEHIEKIGNIKFLSMDDLE